MIEPSIFEYHPRYECNYKCSDSLMQNGTMNKIEPAASSSLKNTPDPGSLSLLRHQVKRATDRGRRGDAGQRRMKETENNGR